LWQALVPVAVQSGAQAVRARAANRSRGNLSLHRCTVRNPRRTAFANSVSYAGVAEVRALPKIFTNVSLGLIWRTAQSDGLATLAQEIVVAVVRSQLAYRRIWECSCASCASCAR